MTKKELNELREQRFVDEYVIDYNAKYAAMRAGYSEKTARNAAAWINREKPTKPRLLAMVDARTAEISRRCGVTAERITNELAAIAFANITDAVDPKTGRLLKDIDRTDAAAVASFRVKRGEDFNEYETRMYDKLKALELLGKRLGMFDGTCADSAKAQQTASTLEKIIEAVKGVE